MCVRMQAHSMQEVIKAWFYYFMHGLGACLACYVRDGVQGGRTELRVCEVPQKIAGKTIDIYLLLVL